MNYKLIVTDMDGTLLNGEHEISQKNKEALKFAADKGVNVAIATGRIYESTIKYARELGIKTPIICCNLESRRIQQRPLLRKSYCR